MFLAIVAQGSFPVYLLTVNKIFRRHDALGRATLIVAFCAMLLRAVMPAGYMPDMQAASGFDMVLCGINGPQTVRVDASFAPLRQEGDTSHEAAGNMCVFALLQHDAAPVFGNDDAPVTTRIMMPARPARVTAHAASAYRSLPPFANGPPVAVA